MMIGRGDWIRTSDLMLPKRDSPTFATCDNSAETNRSYKHDRDLPTSPCLRFVTSYHPISHRHVNVRSTGAPQRCGPPYFHWFELPGAGHSAFANATASPRTVLASSCRIQGWRCLQA